MSRNETQGPRFTNLRNLCSCLLVTLLATTTSGSAEDLSVTVGVYEQEPIVATRNGVPVGLGIDVVEAVADLEGWSLDYQTCEWSRCLEALDAGDLDLMTGIVYTEQRSLRFRFNQTTLISHFAEVFAAPKSNIRTFAELAGQKIAVLEDDIHTTVLLELIERFGISAELVSTSSFENVVRLLKDQQATAGILPQMFLDPGAARRQIEPTGIVFSPVEVRFASPRNSSGRVLEAIDRHLDQFKKTPGSVYYQSLARWVPEQGESRLPRWIPWLVAGIVTVLAVTLIANRALAQRVEARTLELQSEIRERRLAQESLRRLTLFDQLTALPNRLLFEDRLRQAVIKGERRGLPVAVIFIRLDGFRELEKSIGILAAEEILVTVAARMRTVFPDADTLARTGNDEFVAALTACEDQATLTALANRLLESQRQPLQARGRKLVVTASVGSAMYPFDSDAAIPLLRYAEVATTTVAEKGQDGYLPYSSDMLQLAEDRLDREALLRAALAERSLVVEYQPILDLETGATVAVEALARLRKPDGTLLSPDLFVPLAEEVGLINQLGFLVLHEACREWSHIGSEGCRLAINVSPRQLEDPEFLQRLEGILEQTDFSPTDLELELTESVFLGSVAPTGKLFSGLRAQGIRLSIDDFGTGYSSLSYLRRLPISSLKIDQIFVQDIVQSRGSKEIVRAIVALSRGLGIDIVAEGIETEEQLTLLRQLGCPLGQGYLISRPLSAEQLQLWWDSTQSQQVASI